MLLESDSKCLLERFFLPLVFGGILGIEDEIDFDERTVVQEVFVCCSFLKGLLSLLLLLSFLEEEQEEGDTVC